MKTHTPKKADLQPKWYIIDAKDKVLGRMSTVIANKLRGKDQANFTPHMDTGNFVIVVNADKVKLTGKKLDDKMYYRHSGFPGGFKERNARKMLEIHPTKIVELSVSGMLPKNRLRKVFMDKLKIYTDEKHPHEAQKPELLEV